MNNILISLSFGKIIVKDRKTEGNTSGNYNDPQTQNHIQA